MRSPNVLREARERLGISQFEVAKRADISLTNYSNIELGKQVPSLTTAFAIAGVLGHQVEDLWPELVSEAN